MTSRTVAGGSDSSFSRRTLFILNYHHLNIRRSTPMSKKDISSVDQAKSILTEEISTAAALGQDAVMSGAWWYPLYGVLYFVSHPTLYRAVAPVIVMCLGVSFGITIALFTFTYLPQVALCAIITGPLAFIAAFFLVMAESFIAITFVSKAFFLAQAQDKIFDAVLLQQGNEHLVSRGREVKNTSGMKKLGKSITQPLDRFSKEGILRYIISLPLNALPIIGSVLFLLYNGKKAGPNYHARYFQLKGLKGPSRDQYVHQRRGAYTAFGATAVALNMIPFAGLVFGFTSSVGAALWASALEKKERGVSGQAAAQPVDPRSEVRVEL
ncbi:hypothetical protein HGRIS_013403 [Hohenbuehelia grisea]|uniref:Outer spore wall protein RRT8 n=1 Tax=Hohenbuehelia grisea TaxID=104357 RepID=A0ABR3IVI2_9AGAR